jgi:hypothetical protein
MEEHRFRTVEKKVVKRTSDLRKEMHYGNLEALIALGFITFSLDLTLLEWIGNTHRKVGGTPLSKGQQQGFKNISSATLKVERTESVIIRPNGGIL